MAIPYNADNDVLDCLSDPAPLSIVEGYLPRLDRPGLGGKIDAGAVGAAGEGRPPLAQPAMAARRRERSAMVELVAHCAGRALVRAGLAAHGIDSGEATRAGVLRVLHAHRGNAVHEGR